MYHACEQTRTNLDPANEHAVTTILSFLLLLPFVYFAHALDKVWRTYRLRQHGLDPDLVDAEDRRRDAHLDEDYRRRHGHPQD